MSLKKDARFVLVTRKTRLQELVERFNTWPQARFYLEHSQVDAQDYLLEHDHYQAQIRRAEAVLSNLGRLHNIERAFLSSYQFSMQDIIVVIGQDGLVANTLKYLNGQPVIAINPDPARFDGKVVPFEVHQLEPIAKRVIHDDIDLQSVTLAEAVTNDGQKMRAVNDLFIGPKSHTSARYALRWNGKQENQSSSGVIVSTGFGSTGWFQSILAGAAGVSGRHQHPLAKGFAWDAPRLQFAVREPFPSQTTGVDMVFGGIEAGTSLSLESYMPEHGVVFSDGIESDYIAFNAGTVLTVSVSLIKGALVA